ncbi:MAG: PKD domain-containing protein [Bacteroidales bacterium]|nr:PKD domain-containing protein [Bacteroidales bacterium]
MKKTALLAGLVTLGCIQGLSQINPDPDILFREHSETWIAFTLADPSDIGEVSRIVSVDRFDGKEVIANASRSEMERFLSLGIDYRLLPHQSEGFDIPMKDVTGWKESKAWDTYPTYEAYVSLMYQFAADYPGLCQVFSIGQSVQGRELLMARISDNPGMEEDEPEFLYTSTMHGDETAGYILMLHLIDSLLTGYGSAPRITEMVNSMDIFINPLANPDGTYAGGNHTVSGATRRNANYVDLNRNFPDPEDGPHPDGNPWQPETVAFMYFAEGRNLVMSSNIHGGSEVCNYPWDTWARLAADNDWWVFVCNEYADTAQYYSPPGYFDDFGTGITNGYAWYTISGGRQDYMNYFHQCREFTLEISATKLLPANQLIAWWGYNRRSFLNYMEQCLYGLRGVVTDSITGAPLTAEIYILDHEMDSSWIYSHLPMGNYHRPLFAGSYSVKFSAPGYFPKIIHEVTISDYATTILDVQLVPGEVIADFTASKTIIETGSSASFTDLSWGPPENWDWNFPGGTPASSTLQNPTGITYAASGSFPVGLTVTKGTATNTLLRNDYIFVGDPLIMQNGTFTGCHYLFYDSGGAGGSYGNSQDFTLTIYPGAQDSKIVADFYAFELESHSSCNYDWLKVFDGPSVTALMIGTFCGTNGPGTVTSTHGTGALTFQFHSDNSVVKPGWEARVWCEAEPFALDLKVFLEGPFENGSMSTHLSSLATFPLSQPYQGAPWNYAGSEAVSSAPGSPVTDWILLELRDAPSAGQATISTRLARRALFILSDGTIRDLDASSLPTFSLTVQHQLFAVIWHRNHLGVMSANPLPSAGVTRSYDFTGSAAQIYGGALGCRELAPGVWGMTGGDGDASGEINNGDKIEVWSPQAGNGGYLPGDFNMDTEVNNDDKNELWGPNTGRGSQVP